MKNLAKSELHQNRPTQKLSALIADV